MTLAAPLGANPALRSRTLGRGPSAPNPHWQNALRGKKRSRRKNLISERAVAEELGPFCCLVGCAGNFPRNLQLCGLTRLLFDNHLWRSAFSSVHIQSHGGDPDR
jgi:hypothetical protein